MALHADNKKAAPTAAQILDRLGTDNRTVVATPDPAAPDTKVVVASGLGPDGGKFKVGDDSNPTVFTDVTTAKDADGGSLPKADDGIAAGGDYAFADATVAKVPVLGLSKDELRTQYFHLKNGYDATKVGFGAKLCFVNDKGQPLKADGTPADDVASAVDAATTDLTAQGQAVTNWAQVNKTDGSRTGIPGVYDVEPRQTALYAPHVGWTAQETYRAFSKP
jgi:hypothetical protein